MRSRIPSVLPFGILACVLLGPSRAEAIPCIIIWGQGETITHLSDLPPAAKEEARQHLHHDVAVGFKYHSFSIFWCDVWTRDGEYVLFGGDKYWKIPVAELTQLTGKSESELGKPFLYRFPLGLMFLGGIAVVWVGFACFVKTDEDRVKKLLADPRYHQALQILTSPATEPLAGQDAPTPPPEQKYEKSLAAAVDYLEGQGIARQEAEANLALIVTTLASSTSASAEANQAGQA